MEDTQLFKILINGKGSDKHSTAQHSTAQHSTAQHSISQHSTAQHSTAQHSTAQHCTALHCTALHYITQNNTIQYTIHNTITLVSYEGYLCTVLNKEKSYKINK